MNIEQIQYIYLKGYHISLTSFTSYWQKKDNIS